MPEYAQQTDLRTRLSLTRGAQGQRPDFDQRKPEQGPHNYPGGFGATFRYSSRCSYGCGAQVEGDRVVSPLGVHPISPCPNAPLMEPTETPTIGKVFVRGRFTPTGKRFDVLKVHGPRKVELYARDCIWPEEAMELAMACLRGRISIAVNGKRSALGRSKSGLLLPEIGVAGTQTGGTFTRRSPTLVEVTLDTRGE